MIGLDTTIMVNCWIGMNVHLPADMYGKIVNHYIDVSCRPIMKIIDNCLILSLTCWTMILQVECVWRRRCYIHSFGSCLKSWNYMKPPQPYTEVWPSMIVEIKLKKAQHIIILMVFHILSLLVYEIRFIWSFNNQLITHHKPNSTTMAQQPGKLFILSFNNNLNVDRISYQNNSFFLIGNEQTQINNNITEKRLFR